MAPPPGAEDFCMHRISLWIISILMAAPLLAATQSFPGVTVLDHPGGGTIAYAQMPAQHTAQGAITRVMQYVAARFGGTPKVTHVLKSKDGNSLAVTFTVKATTETPGDMTGLALVAVTPSGPGKGAVLSDQSDRFGTTVADMLRQMQQLAPGARATTSMASAAATNPAPVAAGPSAAATPSTTATPAPVGAPSAAASKSAAAPVGPLHATVLPDGSATLGLPDGWKITAAHAGEVIAQGPPPAALHFDYQVMAYDPGKTSPGSGFQRNPGMHAIPYSDDIQTKMSLITAQNAQAQHKSPPTVKWLATQQVAADNYIVVVDVTPGDGSAPFRAYTQIFVGPLNAMGLYSLTMYQVMLTQQLSNEAGNAAVKALLGGYRADNQKIAQELAGDKAASDRIVENFQRQSAANQAITDSYLANSRRSFDAQQRSFAADDYALLGNTVVRDTDFNAHGLVSDNLADALTQADPNRFQEVPPSQYVKGVDY
jgi:hypothetical protein